LRLSEPWLSLFLLGQEFLDYQSMTTIRKENKFITLINVFTVDPAKQHELVNLLTQATESSVRHVPGFISGTLYRSLDGTKVAMYAQWRSVEDYRAMRKNAAALPYMEQALTLAKFESGMYEVVETFEHLPTHA
jgi:heme-degrading monooxygenase HmoA